MYVDYSMCLYGLMVKRVTSTIHTEHDEILGSIPSGYVQLFSWHTSMHINQLIRGKILSISFFSRKVCFNASPPFCNSGYTSGNIGRTKKLIQPVGFL